VSPPRPSIPETERTQASPPDAPRANEFESVVRRAPFADNPVVGARGQRTQQRILEAALRVFGEDGYDRCSIDRIAKRAGCSRVSFYQYFSSKEDVLRLLAGQVARQVNAAAETIGPLTPDADGRAAMRTWVHRYSEIYERYEPLFQVFEAAAESDAALAAIRAQSGEQNIAIIRSRLSTTTLPPRELDPVIALLLKCVNRTFYVIGFLRAAAPATYTSDRVEDALADMFHRSLFGLRPGVNEHRPPAGRPAVLAFDPLVGAVFQQDHVPELAAATAPALTALMDAGHDVLVNRGYYGARIDDIVAAAGVSHGAFYRSFKNKAQFAHVLAIRAMQRISVALVAIPDGPHDRAAGKAALRRWLRRYATIQAGDMAMIRVLLDASLQDATLGADSAPAYDWGRRRMARFLRSREFGDVDVDAVVMLALLDSFGARRRSAGTVDATAYIIERGLLGL
jgi:AcrR family transcriptional regulator